MEIFSDAAQREFSVRVISFFAVILLTFIFNKILIFLMERGTRNRFSSVLYKAQSFVPQTVYFLGFIVAISQLGLSITILLIVVAFLGLGFLLGSRQALENIVARFYLDMFSPYRIGDMLTIDNLQGEVIEVNVLNTVLLDKKEQLIMLPNTTLLSSTVINKSKDARHELQIPVVVSKKISILEFEKRLLQMTVEMSKDLLKTPKPVVVTTRTTPKSEEVTLIVSIRSPDKRSAVTEKLKHKIQEIIDDLLESQETYAPKKV